MYNKLVETAFVSRLFSPPPPLPFLLLSLSLLCRLGCFICFGWPGLAWPGQAASATLITVLDMPSQVGIVNSISFGALRF